jgi:hypothetical protein
VLKVRERKIPRKVKDIDSSREEREENKASGGE